MTDVVRAILVCLCALAAASSPALAQEDRAGSRAEGAKLPPGVVARVHGRDVTTADLAERIVRRWAPTERGRHVLDQLVDDLCVEREAARRGVVVTDEEVARYVKGVDETIRRQTGGQRTIDDVYREHHSDPAEFARVAREYLRRQRMAQEDLGGEKGAEVPEARLKLWLSSLRRRAQVRLTDLPEGAFAVVGATTIDLHRYAQALREQLPEEAASEARADLVLEAATEHALSEAKIVVTDEDVDADIARIRDRFAQDPRVRGTGLTFDEFLRQTRGTSEADLRKDRSFRTRLGLERLLSRRISDADIRRRWEENRDLYGERALVRQVYVAAGEKGGKFAMRSFEEAFERALRAKAATLEGTGIAGAPKRPLAEVLTEVAKRFEEDAQRRQAAGEPVAWTRVQVAGEEGLAKAVFEAEPGTLLGPVRSRVGYHLLMVEERRPAPSFEEIRDAVREDLLRERTATFRLEIKADPGIVLAD